MADTKDIIKKAIAEKMQLRSDYRATFNTVAGKRVLEDLEKRCFVNISTHTPNGSIELNEGMRSVMLHIKSRQNLDIVKFRKMIETQNPVEEE